MSKREESLSSAFSTVGGAMVGWRHAMWPLAKLSVTPEWLRLWIYFSGNVDFAPHEVVALTAYRVFMGSGIRIKHRVTGYPELIVFWCFSPKWLLTRIAEIGFVPKGFSVSLNPSLERTAADSGASPGL